MVFIPEPLRNWFGYTRRERRSASVLLVMIATVIGLRYIVPEKNLSIENLGTLLADTLNTPGLTDDGLLSEDDLSSSGTGLGLTNTVSGMRRTKALARYESTAGANHKVADCTRVIWSDSSGKTKEGTGIRTNTASLSKVGLQFHEKVPIDLNSCDSALLESLPGIGPVLSVRIIKYRNLLGGYVRVEQLMEVYGLPAGTYEMIKGRLFADTSLVRKININSAGFGEMSHIHYLERYDISAILNYRKIAGKIKNIEELRENKIITPEKAVMVEPYINFE